MFWVNGCWGHDPESQLLEIISGLAMKISMNPEQKQSLSCSLTAVYRTWSSVTKWDFLTLDQSIHNKQQQPALVVYSKNGEGH